MPLSSECSGLLTRVKAFDEDNQRFMDFFDEILAAQVHSSACVDPRFSPGSVWIHRGDIDYVGNVHETPLWFYESAWTFYRCQRVVNSDIFKVLDESISPRGVIDDFLKVSVEKVDVPNGGSCKFFNLLEIPMSEGDKKYSRYPTYADKKSRLKMIGYGETPKFDNSKFVPDKPEIIELYDGEFVKVDF